MEMYAKYYTINALTAHPQIATCIEERFRPRIVCEERSDRNEYR